MAQKTAPLFRKSMNGYKREDVNNYILGLNRTMDDNKRMYEKSIEDCNTRAEADYQRICELTLALKEQERQNIALTEKLNALAGVEEELNAKTAELESLRIHAKELEDATAEARDNGEKAKAEYYDSICSKAGEILFIASGTAENILNRANDEAQRIVGDANSKKDLMLKTFSDTVDAAVDAAAGDINTYIRTAVDDCIKKIDRSVKEVTEMQNSPIKRGKATFINDN